MQFIEKSFDFVPQEAGVEGMYKMMERAARQCYKTEHLITEGSSHHIIDDIIIPKGHTSVLEFGTVYLRVPLWRFRTWWKYARDKFSRVVIRRFNVYITTTYRTIMQGSYKNPIEAIQKGFDKDWRYDLKYWCEPTKCHRKRYTYHFVMDRVGSQSVERHRGRFGISYAQESTRYVNYSSKSKGNGKITCCLPEKFYEILAKWIKKRDDGKFNSAYLIDTTLDRQLEFLRANDSEWNTYETALDNAQDGYMELINTYEWKPEDARGTLPLDVKTEFLMCAYPEDWNMFLFRRMDKHAHHQIRSMAVNLADDMAARNIVKTKKKPWTHKK